ncbi:hypothetical protein CYMTET_46777 [Cymbomonas tetramitiformis]|uniref:F-box/LRR-repeat protein 15-like leucin rich repeat domain-containing protein n=1 Tax=Cymbomonas tetramitiformis TaxID=36881 RepID=A0AAE0EYD2_9CHLO|nr:hypothetical protein CYMTET_46777 [Cymbomonas tetramitiformis]
MSQSLSTRNLHETLPKNGAKGLELVVAGGSGRSQCDIGYFHTLVACFKFGTLQTQLSLKPETQNSDNSKPGQALPAPSQPLAAQEPLKQEVGAAADEGMFPPLTSTDLFSLMWDVGAIILEKLDTKEVLLLRSVSQGGRKWVDAVLPFVTHLVCNSDADCTQVERTLCALMQNHKMKIRKFTARFHHQVRDFPALAVMASGCGSLREICLSRSSCVNDTSVCALVRSCPRLRRINLNGCTKVSQSSILEIAHRCLELVWVDVGRCPLVNSACLVSLAEGCPRLAHVNITRCDVGDTAICAIAKHCPELRHLDLTNCPVSNAALLALGRYSSKLRTLLCGANRRLDDTGIEAVSDCVQLKHLLIKQSMMTDDSLKLLVERCPMLRRLDVGGSRCITFDGLGAAAESCPSLELLAIGSCVNLMFEAFSTFTRRSTSITRLVLSSLPFLTDALLQEVVNNCRMLQQLDLTGCIQLTDESLTSLSQLCIHLTTLRLEFCPLVTDLSVVTFATHMSQLSHLAISGCHLVTTGAISFLIDNCPALEFLCTSRSEIPEIARLTEASRNKELKIEVLP